MIEDLPERRRIVKPVETYGEKLWSMMVGYGRRWISETAFSTFKRLYGECCMARNMETIEKELMTKAYIYKHS